MTFANTIGSPLTFEHVARARESMMSAVDLHIESDLPVVSLSVAHTIRSLLDADIIADHMRRILAGKVTPTRRVHRARFTAALNARMRQRLSTETRERANASAFAWFRAMGAPCERRT